MRSQLYCAGAFFVGILLCQRVCCLKTNGNVASAVEPSDGSSVIDGRRSRTETEKCFSMNGANLTLHVQLKKAVDVSFLLLYTTAEDGESVQDLLSGLGVYVGEEEGVCVREVKVGQQGKMARVEVVCDAPVTGSRVTLRLPDRRRTLRLCEVEVYDTTCDCLDGCQVDQGFCFGPCVRNQLCKRENVGLSKQAESSPLTSTSGPPSVVVNGNTGTIFVSRKDTEDVREQNCIATRSSDASITLQPQNSTLTSRERRMTSLVNDVTPWWSVDLGQVVAVRGVVIYRGNADQVWANESVTEVSVNGETCAKYGPETLSRDQALVPRLVVTCDNVIRGQKVKISRVRVSRTAEPAPLELCELQVWSCMAGWYGEQCQTRCGRCKGGRNTCDPISGDCPDGCRDGWFGSTCKRRCSTLCVSGQCKQDTGHCLQCPLNRALPFCTECVDDWHGSTCSERCGQCRDALPCNSTTGLCHLGCAPGFIPPLCTQRATTTTTTTTTSTTSITSTTSNGNVNDTRADENDDDDENDVGVTVGAVVGALTVVVVAIIFIVLFIWYRRRRGRVITKKQAATDPSSSGKPEASKTESFSYVDAMSSSTSTIIATSDKADVTRDVTTTDAVTYDVIGENCYEPLDLSPYANIGDSDDHVYVKPVFTRATSQSSNASEPYVNLGTSASSTFQ